ncbi:hypothetical protein [Cytobacillus sp. NCCP-133]|uniref:hypothetical protein n=1 Tax=Cytobacillus sp. NCCP-133 TaxID=766848 RepID=UPI002232C744|nr:hypothetical protein [Cytobacillus sp. NCCP-133]GLB59577.1 hypothetical protein NCCP133_17100 [Cytobacillus sp. NCCP-133]
MSKNRYKDKAKNAVSKIKANIKGKFFEMTDTPSISVRQLAEFIQQHPETQISKKVLLGNTFTFYHLKINDDFLYMETNNGRILQLDGASNGYQFVSYRSYRDFYDLHTQIRLT